MSAHVSVTIFKYKYIVLFIFYLFIMKKQLIHTTAQEMDIYVDSWNLVFNVLFFAFLWVAIYIQCVLLQNVY